MSNCPNCGAALGYENKCHFCGSLAPLDLGAVSRHTTTIGESDRNCPNCLITLTTINLGDTEQAFYIERCDQCQGQFFDEGEIQALLDDKVQHVHHVDPRKLAELCQTNAVFDPKVVYRKCPVCAQLMNRKNFGARSGVIVDHCMGHGMWLEAGELTQILRWAKAGGQILDHKQKEQAKLDAAKQQRAQLRSEEFQERTSVDWGNRTNHSRDLGEGLVEGLIEGLWKIFR